MRPIRARIRPWLDLPRCGGAREKGGSVLRRAGTKAFGRGARAGMPVRAFLAPPEGLLERVRRIFLLSGISTAVRAVAFVVPSDVRSFVRGREGRSGELGRLPLPVRR